jgi:type II secretory ATPase GspE/PulE/Tfp pilus assembly ATPase PilB-like protein
MTDAKGNSFVCPNCQGIGYRGRTGVFEIMVVDENLQKMLREGANLATVRTYCRKQKMFYLQEESIRKVVEGVTDIKEVIRVCGGQQKSKAQAQNPSK